MNRLKIEIRFSSSGFMEGETESFIQISKLIGGGTRVNSQGWFDGKLEKGEAWVFISNDLSFDLAKIRERFKITGVRNIQMNTSIVQSESFEVENE